MTVAKTIARKIRFYHLRMAGATLFNPSQQIDMPLILSTIDKLFFDYTQLQHSRYWKDPQNSRTYCCWIDEISPGYCHVRFGKIRQDGLPQIEQKGLLTPLALSDDEGIVELMHIVFFADGIIGAEHNYYGPRMAKLLQYLLTKDYHNCPLLEADLLLKKDAAEKLEQLEGIKLLRLKIVSSYIGAVKEADAFVGAAFQAAYEAGESDVVEVVLQNRGKRPLLKRTQEAMLHLFRRKDFAEEVEKAEVVGLGEDDEDVDILSDKLIISREFTRASKKSRQVIPEEMYAAIHEGYDDLRDELRSTAGVTI